MNERDVKKIAIVAGLGLLGLAILNQAYRAGVAAGLAYSGNPRAIDHVHGFGFFPFPPFLLIIGGVLLFMAWRRRWIGNGNGTPGGGPGAGRPPRLFEEWHRRAHEASGGAESAPPANRPEASGGNGGTTV